MSSKEEQQANGRALDQSPCPRRFNITVCQKGKADVTLEIDRAATIADVKAKIYESVKIAIGKQCLMYGDKDITGLHDLPDNATVTLQVLSKCQGGCYRPCSYACKGGGTWPKVAVALGELHRELRQ